MQNIYSSLFEPEFLSFSLIKNFKEIAQCNPTRTSDCFFSSQNLTILNSVFLLFNWRQAVKKLSKNLKKSRSYESLKPPHPISVVYGKIILRPATFQPMKHFGLFGQLEIVWRKNNDWYQITAFDLHFHLQAKNLQICLFWAMFSNVKVWWTFFGFLRKSSNFNLKKSTPNAH